MMLVKTFYAMICLLLLTALAGCQSGGPAVVVDGHSGAMYQVRQGDTLYSIAWAMGVDYRDLMRANRLAPPYRIHLGQHLRVPVFAQSARQITRSHRGWHAARTVYAAKATLKQFWHATDRPKHRWYWPIKGRVVRGFSARRVGGNQGVDIAPVRGIKRVRAAAAGRVVYSGNGLRGYGHLVIIKHSDSVLSAYAYNDRLLIKEGQKVQAKQAIAYLGQGPNGRPLLHFEVRYHGQPVNPMVYLKRG